MTSAIPVWRSNQLSYRAALNFCREPITIEHFVIDTIIIIIMIIVDLLIVQSAIGWIIVG